MIRLRIIAQNKIANLPICLVPLRRIAWLPNATIKRELAECKLVVAGDELWWIDLKVVIYTEAQLHQKQSTRVWQHLQSAATTCGVT